MVIVVILLMAIGEYFVITYWSLLMVIILVAIGEWLLRNILLWILVFINDYYINGY
jgi:hypothetical protein